MAPDLLGGWIHNFTVTETQTHKSGFTLYKITSIIFPRSVPQALTVLTVWRRFHDIKRLHRDLKRRHKSLQLANSLPEPIDCSFFKRFDRDVIQKRKEYIQQLLDFTAQHPALYKCHSFAQFFNETTTPTNRIQKIVQKVRGLNRNVEIERENNEKAQDNSRQMGDTAFQIRQETYTSNYNAVEEEEEGMDECDNVLDDNESFSKDFNTNITRHNKLRFLTPMASVESEDSDYIYEAALEFSQAVQAEANLEYNEAYLRYKAGVELLLTGCKDDHNDDRVYIARAKITKYLARAEDIHERFLKITQRSFASTTSTSNFQLAIDVSGNTNSDSSGLYLERPWNHMAKYKVNCLLGYKVLHVSCITEHLKPNYVMKGIEKPSSNSPTQTVFLPQHVPYMVDLLAFFQSDQKIFLLLKLALGGRLIDYIHSRQSVKTSSVNNSIQFPTNVEEANISMAKKLPLDHDDVVVSSKQLIQSVSNTLKVIKDLEVKSPRRSPHKAVGTCQQRIPECQLKQWARQLLVAVHALHEKSIILCDLHMDNLLLNENGQLLLTYFYQNEGISSDSSIHKAMDPKAMENHFVAPERPLTLRSDWWSYGVIIYELFVGLPFKAAHPGQIDLYGFVQYPENIDISETVRDLLEKLLQQVPEERLDYEHIKQHKFFDGTNWEDIKQSGFNKSKN